MIPSGEGLLLGYRYLLGYADFQMKFQEYVCSEILMPIFSVSTEFILLFYTHNTAEGYADDYLIRVDV